MLLRQAYLSHEGGTTAPTTSSKESIMNPTAIATAPTIPAGDHKVNEKGERYFVFIENGLGGFTEVHHGISKEAAIKSADFWDERVNTHLLTYSVPMDYLSVGNRKFEALFESIRTAA
jgi:hypothetical protein